jgi:glutaredoxin 3
MIAVLQLHDVVVFRRKCLMAKVEIYTTPMCPYCVRAKRLLSSKGVEFIEIDLWQFPARREEMIARAQGRRTVPQVFVDGQSLGGSDDLQALEAAGRLDPLLRRNTAVPDAARRAQ